MVGIVSKIKGALGVKEPALEKAKKTIADRQKASKPAKKTEKAKPNGRSLLGNGMAGRYSDTVTSRNKKIKKQIDSL